MSTSHNKMGSELRKDLAEFGLMRDKISNKKGYFGLSNNGERTSSGLDESGTDMARFVPEGLTSFDLLEPEFGKKLSEKEPKTVRAYLRKVLESV